MHALTVQSDDVALVGAHVGWSGRSRLGGLCVVALRFMYRHLSLGAPHVLLR